MRIVLDTNVLVSGLLNSKGNPATILSLALRGAVKVCYDGRILAEYAEVLARPHFKFDPQRTRDVLGKLEADGVSVSPSQAALGLPDRDDEPFLAVALAAPADYLVTGNTADYPADKCRGARVVTPAEFVALWRTVQPETSQPGTDLFKST